MNTLVSLRKRIDELNDEDFQSLVVLIGRQSLTTLLFQGLLRQMIHNQSQKELSSINQIVKDVMKIRLEKEKLMPITDPDSNDDRVPIDINDLPDVMLSEISSYLLFEDQLNFEKLNRPIFIGSRSSSLPQHSMTASLFRKWILYHEKHQDSIHPHHRQFKSIEIDSEVICTWDRDADPMVLPSSTTLSIPFMDKACSMTIRSVRDDDLSAMLNALVLNQSDYFPNLKQLRVLPSSEEIRYFPPALRLLIERSNLEYFECEQYIHEEIDWNECTWAAKLKGIAFYDWEKGLEDQADIYNSVFSQITNRIESLHLRDGRVVSALQGKLENLKELCVHIDLSEDAWDREIWSKHNLQSLKRVNIGYMELDEMLEDGHPFILWLEWILQKVEYLSCDGHLYVLNLLRILQLALNQISGRKRALRIQLSDSSSRVFDSVQEAKDFGDALLQLTAVLNAKCFDWMLIIRAPFCEWRNGISAELQKMELMLREENCCDLKVDHKDSSSYCHVILSKDGSQMNPHRAEKPWDMICEHYHDIDRYT